MNYTVIKNTRQYDQYCIRLMDIDTKKPSRATDEEMELLELLIDKWEHEQFNRTKMNPVQIIEHLMEIHELSRNDMLRILGIKRSALRQIISYQKGLSKNVIRKLSEKFCIAQETFNRPYTLKTFAK